MHLLELVNSARDGMLKKGLTSEQAQKYIDEHAGKDWVDQPFQENAKQGLLNQIDEIKTTNFLFLTEQEVYAYYRFQFPELEAQKNFETWLKRYNKGNGFPL